MFAEVGLSDRNCSQPSATVRGVADWPCHWGKLYDLKKCHFAPLFHCDLHESGMSCKKGDAFRCTGAGFRESDTFASQFHWDLQFPSGVLEVLNRAVTLGFAVARWLEKLRFCDKSQVKREQKVSKSFETLGKVTILDVLKKVPKGIFRGRHSTW